MKSRTYNTQFSGAIESCKKALSNLGCDLSTPIYSITQMNSWEVNYWELELYFKEIKYSI
ncbi:MAG: hypothetical protein JNM95_01645 [Chitinophagaceae bacterium]|nr:hypothetical protein [Chitinophagaceae bacterium]